jgi:hypothetical protein
MASPLVALPATSHAGGSQVAPARGDVQDRHGATDDRQRMIVNITALLFVLFLTGTGVWLATTIRDLRRTQDCLLVGRRDCARMPILPMAPPLTTGGIGGQFASHI